MLGNLFSTEQYAWGVFKFNLSFELSITLNMFCNPYTMGFIMYVYRKIMFFTLFWKKNKMYDGFRVSSSFHYWFTVRKIQFKEFKSCFFSHIISKKKKQNKILQQRVMFVKKKNERNLYAILRSFFFTAKVWMEKYYPSS